MLTRFLMRGISEPELLDESLRKHSVNKLIEVCHCEKQVIVNEEKLVCIAGMRFTVEETLFMSSC